MGLREIKWVLSLKMVLLLLVFFNHKGGGATAAAAAAAAAEACSNGGCKLAAECSPESYCGAGLYCFSCPQAFSGSRCVRSSTTDPFNLLNGVRGLMLDTYDFRGDVWLCHSFGGKCYDSTAFEPAIDTLKEIEAFLTSKPMEIVTLILEDYVKALNELSTVFKRAGLMKYWFPAAKMPLNGHDLIEDGDGGMEAGKCPAREHTAPLNDHAKSLVLVNHFDSIPVKQTACEHNSADLVDMLSTCHAAAGNRWANFVAVDYYKRSNGGGACQAVDFLNGKLLCGRDDLHSCRVR